MSEPKDPKPKNKRPNTVYAMIDPRNGRVRYVGCTAKGLKHRLSVHKNDYASPEKLAWLLLLESEGLEPIMTVLETVLEGGDVYEREEYWQRYYLEREGDLLNKRIGRTLSDEHRRKISARLAGNQHARGHGQSRPHTTESRRKLSEAWQHRTPPSPETRAKQSASLRRFYAQKRADEQAEIWEAFISPCGVKRQYIVIGRDECEFKFVKRVQGKPKRFVIVTGVMLDTGAHAEWMYCFTRKPYDALIWREATHHAEKNGMVNTHTRILKPPFADERKQLKTDFLTVLGGDGVSGFHIGSKFVGNWLLHHAMRIGFLTGVFVGDYDTENAVKAVLAGLGLELREIPNLELYVNYPIE